MSFNEDVAIYLAKLDRRIRRLELIENLESGSISASGAPIGAQYVTLAANATLTNERVLKAGSGIALTDNGTGAYVWVDFRAGSGLQYSASTLELAPHSHTSTNVTDFGEATRDAIGAALTNSATVEWQVSDVGDTISACVVGGSAASSASTQLLLEPFLRLPGLQGFWPMSAGVFIQDARLIPFNLATGYASGEETLSVLDSSGCPEWGYDTDISYIEFNQAYQGLIALNAGTWGYLKSSPSFAGLTVGGWFGSMAASPDNILPVIGKWDTASSMAGYRIVCACNRWAGQVSEDGTTISASVAGASVVPNDYTFVVLRYTPSGSLSIFVDGTKTVNDTGIPASLYSAFDTYFTIGTEGEVTSSSYYFQGRVSMCFLAMATLSDALIENLYQSSRWGFDGLTIP